MCSVRLFAGDSILIQQNSDENAEDTALVLQEMSVKEKYLWEKDYYGEK